MSLRKLLIRIMLWALGATAVLGAATVLVVGMNDVGGRMIGTGVATTVAALLMIPFSFLADKPKARREGLLGMALVVIEFAFTLGLIWRVFQSLGSWDLEERIGTTMLFLFLVGLPAILFLRFASMPAAKVCGYAGLGLCAVVFIFFAIGIWSGQHSWMDEWMESGGAIAGIGILGVACLAGSGGLWTRAWRWAGVLAAVVAAAIAVYAICYHIRSDSAILPIIISVAAVAAHANLCLLVPLTSGQRWLGLVTIAAGLATAIAIDIMCIAHQRRIDLQIMENLAGASGIISACGSLALLVLARINRNLDRVPVLSEIKQITIICPGCQKKQTVDVGDSTCGTCGLKLSIKLEEPRCPKCDYLLFMLQSDRCPECGEPLSIAAPQL